MSSPERAAKLARLLDATHPETRARAETNGALPVHPALGPLLPDGALPTGVVTAVGDVSLLLALTGGVSEILPGSCAGVVGMPELGLAAWVGHGQDLRRGLLVDEPGDHWAEVVSVLIGACDVVIAAPPAGALSPTVVRRLAGRLRQHRCALVTPDLAWPGAALQLSVSSSSGWEGLGQGWGQITGRRVVARCSGRGVWRPREVELMLPDEDGRVSAVAAGEQVVALPAGPEVRLFDVAAQAF